MKKLFAGLSLIALTLGLCCVSFAATEYVIVNHDSYFENFLSVYTLDASKGTLQQVGLLATNGDGLGGLGRFINFGNIEQAVSPNGSCIFALNAYSSDIAAFSSVTQYSLVGNYSNSALNASENGGSLALTSNGKFLYASYSFTGNIGAWQVNPDCSLTFVASYVPQGDNAVGAIKVSPNGQALVVPFWSTIEAPGLAEIFGINSSSGSLNDLGYLPNTCKLPAVCLLNGLDFTSDSKLVAFAATASGNGPEYPYALIAHVTATGLVQPRSWPLQKLYEVRKPISPVFSSAGYEGSGSLYFGSTTGVITTDFVENPLGLRVTNAVIAGGNSDGGIAITGNTMVMAVPPDKIDVFSINPDGSLMTLSTTTVEGQNLDVFSLTLFPNTR